MSNATLNRETAIRPMIAKRIEAEQKRFTKANDVLEPARTFLDVQRREFSENPCIPGADAVIGAENVVTRSMRTLDKAKGAVAWYSAQVDRDPVAGNPARVEKLRILSERFRCGQMNGRQYRIALTALRVEWETADAY